MTTLLQRVFARLDHLVGWEMGSGNENEPHSYDFYPLWGRRMLILKTDGQIRCSGGSWWVRHDYDGNGKLLRRTRVCKDLQPGEKVIYGQRRVYSIYENQPAGKFCAR